jgi:DNA polymerase zeta
VTKKRYVGFKYEARDWKKPEFEAKGIETVRRDGIPATQKMMEQSIRYSYSYAYLGSTCTKYHLRYILQNLISDARYVRSQIVPTGSVDENSVGSSVGARFHFGTRSSTG